MQWIKAPKFFLHPCISQFRAKLYPVLDFESAILHMCSKSVVMAHRLRLQFSHAEIMQQWSDWVSCFHTMLTQHNQENLCLSHQMSLLLAKWGIWAWDYRWIMKWLCGESAWYKKHDTQSDHCCMNSAWLSNFWYMCLSVTALRTLLLRFLYSYLHAEM